jgi:hypothetical protein
MTNAANAWALSPFCRVQIAAGSSRDSRVFTADIGTRLVSREVLPGTTEESAPHSVHRS